MCAELKHEWSWCKKNTFPCFIIHVPSLIFKISLKLAEFRPEFASSVCDDNTYRGDAINRRYLDPSDTWTQVCSPHTLSEVLTCEMFTTPRRGNSLPVVFSHVTRSCDARRHVTQAASGWSRSGASPGGQQATLRCKPQWKSTIQYLSVLEIYSTFYKS